MSITVRKYRYRNFHIEHQVPTTTQADMIEGNDRFIIGKPDGAIISGTPTLSQACKEIDDCLAAETAGSIAA
jgi:hypothetical protein